MENAVVMREEITETKVTEYLDSAGITSKLLDCEKKMFFNIAREFGLNPFKREIHITAYGQGDNRKCSIITGYEVYIKRAERTGKLDGWEAKTEGEGKTLKAVVTIYRKDHKFPFVHEAYYSECCQYNKDGFPNAVWNKMPKFMTKKVAIGQAFRLCFCDDLGGMPYEEAEVVNYETVNITPNRTPDPEAQQPESDTAPSPQNLPEKQRRENAKLAIEKILNAKKPDGKSHYFDKKEIDKEKEIFNDAPDLDAVKEQYLRLKHELENREYADIPFGDEYPAFKDDIPE